MVEYVERASSLGLEVLGFCEHADFDPRDSGWRTLDLEGYDRAFAAEQAAAPGVSVLQGVEITYQSSREAEIRTWIGSRPWDFVVISVHLVDYEDGWAIVSDPRSMNDYCASHSQVQAYGPYFEELLRAARSRIGDVLGHFDLVKRYGTSHFGPFDPMRFEPQIREVLRAAVDTGLGLEVNASGLRQLPREPYPGLTILRWYRQLGGEVVTVGSDAHHTRDLGAGIDSAVELVRRAGFRAVAVFRNRQARWITI